MGYVILLICGLVFALIGCAYMNLFEVLKYNLTDKIGIKDIFIPVSVKRAVYEVFGVIAVIAIGMSMRYFFPQDSYIHQAKLQFLIAALIALAFIDYRHKIVPNKAILFCLFVRVIFLIFEFIFERGDFFVTIKSIGWGALILGVFLFLCSIITKGGIGMGDVKLFMIMVTFQGLTNSLTSIFMSLLICFFVSLVLIILKKKKLKDTLPLVPSICLGTYISVLLTGM